MRQGAVILFLLFNSATMSGVSQLDSLERICLDQSLSVDIRLEAFQEYYTAMMTVDPRAVLGLSEAHLQLAKEREDDEALSDAYNHRAHAYYVLGKIDSSLIELEHSFRLATRLGDTERAPRLMANMGLLEREQNNYAQAMAYFFQCLRIQKEKEDHHQIGDLHNNIGIVYQDLKAHDLSYLHLDSARAHYIKAGKAIKGVLFYNLASNERYRGNLDEALKNALEAKRRFEAENNMFSLSGCLHELALIWQLKGELDSARIYAQSSRALHGQVGDNWGQVDCWSLLYNLEHDSLSKALIADSIAQHVGDVDAKLVLQKAYEVLYEEHKRSGEMEEALRMHELYLAYRDSVRAEDVQLSLYRQGVESVLSKEHNEELETVREEQEDAIRSSRIGNWLMGGAVLLCILLFTCVLKARKNRYNKEKEALLSQLEVYRQEHDREKQGMRAPFHIARSKVEASLGRALNETDWLVLSKLAEDPVISNRELAKAVFVSEAGLGSALRRMYQTFEVDQSNFKRISLILKAVQWSE